MFAPRRLCVYPPSLLAPTFPAANPFVSPTYTKFARNSFVSPTYANTGGWAPKYSPPRPTTSSVTFNSDPSLHSANPITLSIHLLIQCMSARRHSYVGNPLLPRFLFFDFQLQCRRADIPGIVYFLFSTFTRRLPLSSHEPQVTNRESRHCRRADILAGRLPLFLSQVTNRESLLTWYHRPEVQERRPPTPT